MVCESLWCPTAVADVWKPQLFLELGRQTGSPPQLQVLTVSSPPWSLGSSIHLPETPIPTVKQADPPPDLPWEPGQFHPLGRVDEGLLG